MGQEERKISRRALRPLSGFGLILSNIFASVGQYWTKTSENQALFLFFFAVSRKIIVIFGRMWNLRGKYLVNCPLAVRTTCMRSAERSFGRKREPRLPHKLRGRRAGREALDKP